MLQRAQGRLGWTELARIHRIVDRSDGNVVPQRSLCPWRTAVTTDPAPLEVHRLAAFTDDPAGGNPAGVVVTPAALDAVTMLAIAADVGYSETAFLVPSGPRRYVTRYFAPAAEVSFCGHATIAAAVHLEGREGPGRLYFETTVGDVAVDVDRRKGAAVATLTSIPPVVEPAEDALLGPALDLLGMHDDLDGTYAPAVAGAGARHLILVVATREALARLAYPFDDLAALMRAHDLTTVALLWRESDDRWHARNAFPVGGVVEDPATGAAAAAFGAYLRAGGHLRSPADLEILQGEDMGRPSRLQVHVPASGGIAVTGTAVPMT